MYYIGPLLFWACAEMTCGFFVLCAPSLPRLIQDSGCWRGIKRAFGVRPNKLTPEAPNSSTKLPAKTPAGILSSSRKKRFPTDTDILSSRTAQASAYYEVDEEAVGLDELKKSESTENLREGDCPGGNVHVVRTVAVTNAPLRPGDEDFHGVYKLGLPWARSTK